MPTNEDSDESGRWEALKAGSADPFMAAAAGVVAAAIAYIEYPGDTDGEGKDLFYSLESAVMAYRAAEPGRTTFRCWTCKQPIERGARCACGRGWFVERVP